MIKEMMRRLGAITLAHPRSRIEVLPVSIAGLST